MNFVSVAQTELVVFRRAAREDRRQHHLGLRLLGADFLQNLADAEDGVGRRLVREVLEVPRIVRADHEEHALRLVAIQFAVVEPPQHVLRAVAARSEVKHLPVALGEIFLLLFPAPALPEVGYGVADEYHLRAAFGDFLHLFDVALHLPAVGFTVPGDWRYGADCAK